MWLLMALLATSSADTRVKDVGSFHGVRDNALSGAGLVVGLRRTGDTLRNEAAIRALSNRLQGLGIGLELQDISSRNVALVMVSATLGPDARTGARLDVTVASSGDASSLEGGVLLMTPLMGPDGQVHAVAEGSLVVGGYQVEAGGNSKRRNMPTVGRISGGAVVEREVPSSLDYRTLEQIDFVLRTPDFTTANQLAEAVDTAFELDVASAVSSSTVELVLPPEFVGNFAAFAARVEAIELSVDAPARVVVNERTGTVVMGADVRISAVAIAHGGLTIEVRRRVDATQPAPLSAGTTTVIENTTVEGEEGEGRLVLVEGVEIGELVSSLNDLGVKPRDLVIILEAIRSAGALHAEIVTQ